MLSWLLLATALIALRADADFAFSSALPNPSPEESKLVDLARYKGRLFAAGERGLVAFSDDRGTSWKQSLVPVSVSLTDLAFTPGGVGFAVGHGGIILRSADRGESWETVFDGVEANRQFLAWAEANQDRRQDELEALQASGSAQRTALEDAEYALEDAIFALEDAQAALETGPADPFLAIAMIDNKVGVAAGAYGMVYRTEDGGDTWRLTIDGVDNPERFHFYSLVVDDRGRVHASGEAGLLYYSDDAGATWTRAYDVYDGSLFALVKQDDALFAVGLRGNVFRSDDGGESWAGVTLPGAGSLYAGVAGGDGRLVLVGTGGRILYSPDGGTSFVERVHPTRSALSDVIVAGDQLFFASMGGFIVESLGDYDGD